MSITQGVCIIIINCREEKKDNPNILNQGIKRDEKYYIKDKKNKNKSEKWSYYIMTCRGICIRYKSKKVYNTCRYEDNEKRCQICEIFIRWNGISCPCCSYKLRNNSRNPKSKIKKYIE